MKKSLLVIFLILVLILTGCNKNKDGRNNNPIDNEQQTAIDNKLVSKLESEKDWVYDADYVKNASAESYMTEFNETYYAKDIVVPYINVDSPDAKLMNLEIKAIFDSLIETYNEGFKDSLTYVDTCEYKYCINDNILSGVLTYSVGATDVPLLQYYTFNIDLKEGDKITYKEAYRSVGFDDSNINFMAKSAITREMSERVENILSTTEAEEYINASKDNYQASIQNDDIKFFIDNHEKLNVIVTLSIPAGQGSFDTIITVENDKQATKIEFLDSIYGLYGNEYDSAVFVYPGKDDNHINIGYNAYRTEGFEVNDVEIIRENDLIKGTKVIINTDESFGSEEFENAKMDLTIESGIIKLAFDKNVLMYGDKTKNTVIEEKKDGILAITEKEKQKALNIVKESNGNIIDNNVFEVVKDNEGYLVLRVKCYVYVEPYIDSHGHPVEGYYHMEGSESIGMSKYYNFDKKNNKFVNLSDLTNGSYTKLNEYIKTAIDSKKQGWIDGTDGQWNSDNYSTVGTDWPYWEKFNGIGNPDYFENYFLIDGENKIVKIRCLSYPDEATRAYGDICVDVPFSVLDSID